MLLAECKIAFSAFSAALWDPQLRGAAVRHFGTRYAESELSPVVRPCMCEHGEYKLYRTDRMGARREDRDREGEMHAGVTWGNWITMQRGNKRREGGDSVKRSRH